MIAMISAAPASGALVGFSLGLVGGGGSILAMRCCFTSWAWLNPMSRSGPARLQYQ